MESLAMTAAEVQNPRRALAKAVGRVFYRILAFYVLGILIVGTLFHPVIDLTLMTHPAGMLVPFNDPQLLQSTGTAASSPFVLAMTRVGVKGLPCEYFSLK
jgi:amino acid transporter